MMPKILKDILTNADGVTGCHAKISGAVTTVLYWGMTIVNYLHTHIFDYVQFSMGYVAILTAVCGGVLLKKSTELS